MEEEKKQNDPEQSQTSLNPEETEPTEVEFHSRRGEWRRLSSQSTEKKRGCCTSPKFILISMLGVSFLILAIILVTRDPHKRSFSNSFIAMDIHFSFEEGTEANAIFEISLKTPKKELQFNEGSVIYFKFSSDRYAITEHPMLFLQNVKLAKGSTLRYRFSIPKTDFFKSTRLEVWSSQYPFREKIRLR